MTRTRSSNRVLWFLTTWRTPFKRTINHKQHFPQLPSASFSWNLTLKANFQGRIWTMCSLNRTFQNQTKSSIIIISKLIKTNPIFCLWAHTNQIHFSNNIWKIITTQKIISKSKISQAIFKVNLSKKLLKGRKCKLNLRVEEGSHRSHRSQWPRSSRLWSTISTRSWSKKGSTSLFRIRITSTKSYSPTLSPWTKSSWTLLFQSFKNCSKRSKGKNPPWRSLTIKINKWPRSTISTKKRFLLILMVQVFSNN